MPGEQRAETEDPPAPVRQDPMDALVRKVVLQQCLVAVGANQRTYELVNKALTLYEFEEKDLSRTNLVQHPGTLLRANQVIDQFNKNWLFLPRRELDLASDEARSASFLRWLSKSSVAAWVRAEIVLSACPEVFIDAHPELAERKFLSALILKAPDLTGELEDSLRIKENGNPAERRSRDWYENTLKRLAGVLSLLGLQKVDALLSSLDGGTQRLNLKPWTEAAVLAGEAQWLEKVAEDRQESVARFILGPPFGLETDRGGFLSDAKVVRDVLGKTGTQELLRRLDQEAVRRGFNPQFFPSSRDLLAWVVESENISKHRLKVLVKWADRWSDASPELKEAKHQMLTQFIRHEFPKTKPESVPLDPRILDLMERASPRKESPSFLQDWQAAIDDALSILPTPAFEEFVEKAEFNSEQRKYMRLRQALIARGLHVKPFQKLLENGESFQGSEYLPYYPELEQSLRNALGPDAPPGLKSEDLPSSPEPIRLAYVWWIERSALEECLKTPKVAKAISPAIVKLYENSGRKFSKPNGKK